MFSYLRVHYRLGLVLTEPVYLLAGHLSLDKKRIVDALNGSCRSRAAIVDAQFRVLARVKAAAFDQVKPGIPQQCFDRLKIIAGFMPAKVGDIGAGARVIKDLFKPGPPLFRTRPGRRRSVEKRAVSAGVSAHAGADIRNDQAQHPAFLENPVDFGDQYRCLRTAQVLEKMRGIDETGGAIREGQSPAQIGPQLGLLNVDADPPRDALSARTEVEAKRPRMRFNRPATALLLQITIARLAQVRPDALKPPIDFIEFVGNRLAESRAPIVEQCRTEAEKVLRHVFCELQRRDRPTPDDIGLFRLRIAEDQAGPRQRADRGNEIDAGEAADEFLIAARLSLSVKSLRDEAISFRLVISVEAA